MSVIQRSAQAGDSSGPGPRPARYTGEVVYIYAFDIAYELERIPGGTLLGQPLAEFVMDASKRNPRQLFFFRPQMVRLTPSERLGPFGPVRVERSVKLLPVGAVSLTVRVPFAVNALEDLVVFHDLQFSNSSLHQEVRHILGELREELLPHCLRPVPALVDEEAYTVFCLESPLLDAEGAPLEAEDWLHINRRKVAALLTQEADVDHLSRQEVDESTGRSLSYYEHDVAVFDWDAALLVDRPRSFDEMLYVIELANVQLAELEAYDRILDGSLERSYRDLGSRSVRRRKAVLRELREIRIDFARLSDELQNITKFFGDWHLARIYENLAARFHLPEWHRTIDEKLKTLDGLYQLLQHDQMNRWMLILEVAIVLLFIVDLIALFYGMRH